MKWIQAAVCTSTAGVETVCAALSELGINGFEIEDKNDFNEFLEKNSKYWDYVDEELLKKKQGETKVKFYIEKNEDALDRISDVKAMLERLRGADSGGVLGRLALETDELEEQDWANNWKKYFNPAEVGEKILICPEWRACGDSGGRIVFTVNPGLAFGTGTHASTRLCICELEKAVDANTNLLDIGCGSGILSIIALLLGAQSADAADIDENCVHTALDNARRNNVDISRYHVYSGDILTDSGLVEKFSAKKYDVIVANIVADVIIALLPTVKRLIKPNGTFICSGIINERLDDVLSAMKAQKITQTSVSEENGWSAVTCKF